MTHGYQILALGPDRYLKMAVTCGGVFTARRSEAPRYNW